MFINALSLMNAVNVPIEIAFSINTPGMDALNYIMDIIFFADIVINFRTIVFDHRTNDPITDSRFIAWNYIKGGRFFMDLVSTIPIEVIGDIAGTSISKGTLKLVGLLKLTRLLRISRIITFIKMKKSFKYGIRMTLLGIYLFLIIHFMGCGIYYVFTISEVWIPANAMIT
jgi:hypothetical protein